MTRHSFLASAINLANFTSLLSLYQVKTSENVRTMMPHRSSPNVIGSLPSDRVTSSIIGSISTYSAPSDGASKSDSSSGADTGFIF